MSFLKILWARRGSKRQEKENKSHKVLSNAFSDRQLQETSWGTTCVHWGEYSASNSPELKKAFFQKEVIFGNTMLAHLDWGRSNSFWGGSISTTCWFYSRLARITPNCITGEGRIWINWWGSMATVNNSEDCTLETPSELDHTNWIKVPISCANKIAVYG